MDDLIPEQTWEEFLSDDSEEWECPCAVCTSQDIRGPYVRVANK